MALLEVVQRKLIKTGAIYRLVRLLPRLSFLLTCFSIIFLCALPMDGQYRHTYISENALMPSQAHSFFRESEWNYVRGYRNEVVQMMNYPVIEKNKILNEWLTIMGYKTDIYNHTDSETGEIKQTLYAIYHAPKGDDTEAMVLAAPWHNEENKLNVGALALTLGMARYLRRLSIWAKNVIIVFPEDGGETLRSWVDAYHTSLDNTGGSIEAAIILDCSTSKDYIGYLDIDYTGVNGQLPNLDLLNTAVMVASNEGLKISVNNAPFGQLWTNDYYSRLASLFNGIFNIASAGIVNCRNAQSFSGWNIQSITLRGVEGESNDITSFGRVIEGTFRSVNNLLEKFHQSFFFYLMLGPKLFVSVGMYLPAGGLCATAFVVASINAYIGGFDSSANVVQKMQGGLSFTPVTLASACFTAISTIGLSMFYALYTSGIYGNSKEFDYTKITYDSFIYPLYFMILLPIITFPISFKIKVNSHYVRSLSLMVLFFMGYSLVGLMVLNFPLAILIGLCSSPLCFVRYSSESSFKTRVKNSVLLLISSPATWLLIFGISYKSKFDLDRVRNFLQYFQYGLLQKEIQNLLDFIEDSPANFFIESPVEFFKGLLKSYSKVQCWTWFYICFSWLPVWLCMCIVGSSRVYDAVEVDSKKKNQ